VNFGSVPFLSARVCDDQAWITWLYVPRALRRHGLGRRMVEEWQAHMPAGVREIRVAAADFDDVDPVPFWERLGFHAVAPPPDLEALGVLVMSREVPPHDTAA
jgi:GNAT superfamily N-acetyltransferase